MPNRLLCAVFIAAPVFGQIATTTSVTVPNNPIQIGQTISLTAAVSPAATGTVMFVEGFNVLGTALLNGSSVAALNLRFPVPRTYRIRAVYSGSPSHAASISAPLALMARSLTPTGFLTPFSIPTPRISADLNRDGIPDIVTADLLVFLANGNGTYQSPKLAAPSKFLGAIADYTSDGRPDILTQDGFLLQGNGDGTFGSPQPTTLNGNVAPSSVDLNRDGNADAIVDVPGVGRLPGSTVYALGAGTGSFAPQQLIPGPRTVGITDFDGNTAADGLYILVTSVPVGASAFFDLTSSNIAQLAVYPNQGILTGDVNGDGLDDVITNRSVQGTTKWDIVTQLSDGARSFLPPISATVAQPMRAVQLVDWNGDSKLDLIVAETLNSSTVAVSYLPGVGTGVFAVGLPIGTFPATSDPIVSEVTGDAYPDLIFYGAETKVFPGSPHTTAPVGFTAPVSITPDAGEGNAKSFVVKYSTSVVNGASSPVISLAYVLFNAIMSGSEGCLVEISIPTRTFRLWSDASQSWLGPIAPGAPAALTNSRCTLTGSGSQVPQPVIKGTVAELDAVLNLSFSSAFAGTKNAYGLSIGSDGVNSGWKQLGVWTIPMVGPGNPTITPGGTPSVVSLTPALGAASTGVFTAQFSHTAGVGGHYLGYMLFLPTPNVVNFVATGSCLVEYNRISGGMRLIDDAGTGWLGGTSGLTIGVPGNSLSNSFCTVDIANATAVLSATSMTVTVPITFSTGLGQRLATFVQELDVSGTWTGMTQFGNWTNIGGGPPAPGPSITTFNAVQTGATQVITIAANSGGTIAPSHIHLRIGTSIVGAPVCHVVFATQSGAVALINDAENALVTGGFVTIGANQLLANARCSFQAAQVTRTVIGGQATVSVPLSFTNFSGPRNAYVNVFDNQGRLTHWQNSGTLTLP
ncbi:MAG TPA: FG-GAP-like repeat-containing protein [Bryobacteraceae bacterium]|nr:FG-GAP-like repeat-containing protein [Bryobacteraceae bacterium]